MAARRRTHKTKDLPPNLYCRNGYYSFRDPRSGKEYGLGRDKRIAVNEAIAANMTMMPSAVSLADRLNGKEILLFDELLNVFTDELKSRGLSHKTMKDYESKIKHITQQFAGVPVEKVTTRGISNFLDKMINEGKNASANLFRSTLSDIFKTGIRKGIIVNNPVSNTRAAKVTIEKDRLLLVEYKKIREEAEKMPPWVGLSLDLALVTGQRIGDLIKMKWSDVSDKKLNVIQSKTKKMLSISLDHGIIEFNLTIKSVLDSIKNLNEGSDKVLGGRSTRVVTNSYRAARDAANIEWRSKPAPFHEIRSLSGRLYLRQKNIEFAQNILGHETVAMTSKYIDGRQKEWLDV